MKITDRLKVEHGIFLVQLRQLEKMVASRAPAAARWRRRSRRSRARRDASRGPGGPAAVPGAGREGGADAQPLRAIRPTTSGSGAAQRDPRQRANPQNTTELVRTLTPHGARDPRVFVLAWSFPSRAALDVQLGRAAHLRGIRATKRCSSSG
jgi:hypothetical protein